MILEGIVTTLDAGGSLNIAPMGPRVDVDMSKIVLRPFKTAQTYANLQSHPEGVFHVTDDVWVLARAAVGPIQVDTVPARTVRGRLLPDACRAYEFRVIESDARPDRASLRAEIVDVHRLRDFFGFNRAKHAVVEAAILATRIGLLPGDEILAEFKRLAILVEKTGGEQEHRAFDFLHEFVRTSQAPVATPEESRL